MKGGLLMPTKATTETNEYLRLHPAAAKQMEKAFAKRAGSVRSGRAYLKYSVILPALKYYAHWWNQSSV